jgi:hypothetical protein
MAGIVQGDLCFLTRVRESESTVFNLLGDNLGIMFGLDIEVNAGFPRGAGSLLASVAQG